MRGVNKLVLEIKPDGEYFEKALLFLKPSSAELSQHEISEGAQRLLNRIEDKNKKKKHSFKTAFLWSSVGALAMYAAMTVISYLQSVF